MSELAPAPRALPDVTQASGRTSSPSRASQTGMSTGSGSGSNKRALASCQRCRIRKIKCDIGLDGCSPCKKAKVECIDLGKKDQEVRRSIHQELVDRIIWLQSIVAQRCPDVDLRSGPAAHILQTLGIEVAAPPVPMPVMSQDTNAASIPVVRQQPVPRPRLESNHPENHHDHSPAPHGSMAPPFPVPSSVASTSEPEELSHEVGLVSLVGSSETKYVGPSSGFSFAKLVRSTLQETLPKPLPADVFTSPSGLITPRHRANDYKFTMPPALEASALTETYFDTIHFQFPCLHYPTFIAHLERIYSESLAAKPVNQLDTNGHVVLFQGLLVLAIACRSSTEHLRVSVNPEALFNRAMMHLEQVMSAGSTIERSQCLLLVAIYSIFSPCKPAPNTWMLSYHLMALCVDLGFQRKLGAAERERMSPLQSDLRKRIFWSVYSLDRILSCALGRPLGLRDEGFDIDMPADVEDAELSEAIEWGPSPVGTQVTSMTPSIRQFELLQIISDIKLHLYRVRKGPDRFPWPADLDRFRTQTFDALKAWHAKAVVSTQRSLVRAHLELRYHSAVLLLFLPSPAFPKVSPEGMSYCMPAASEMIRVLDSQQRLGRLPRSYLLVHDTLLSGLVIIFSLLVCAPEHLPANRFVSEIRACSSILAALSDTWAEARKARNVFDKLADIIMAAGLNAAYGASHHFRHAQDSNAVPAHQSSSGPGPGSGSATGDATALQLLADYSAGYSVPSDSFLGSQLLGNANEVELDWLSQSFATLDHLLAAPANPLPGTETDFGFDGYFADNAPSALAANSSIQDLLESMSGQLPHFTDRL
ncbi:hypothetical protein I317_07704 [Kwoniella heveanensis CBS 569]|nr:hypothetical protein I317_07704 [Kwoniella heveanensis CBS 569]